MPSAIKLVKHAERGSRHAKKIEMRENTNNADSVAVMNLSKAFENKNADVALDMLKQPSVLGRLMRADKKRDIVCFYALHAVLLLVKDKDCNAVLQQMTDTDIEDLKLLLRIAKSRSCPDQDRTLDYLSSMLVKFGKGDVVSDTMITSVRLYLDVSHVWEKSVVELDKWTDATDNFVRVLPFDKKWLTLKELCEALKFEKIGIYYSYKSKLSKIHPEIEAWFIWNPSPDEKGLRFNAEHFQELKQLMDTMREENHKKKFSKVADQPKGTWTILEFAKKIGVQGDTESKKRLAVFNIKYALKKKFPEVVSYFTPDGQYFYIKYFEDFQNMRALSRQRKRGASKKNLVQSSGKSVVAKPVEKKTKAKKSPKVKKAVKVAKPTYDEIRAQLDKVLADGEPTMFVAPEPKQAESTQITLVDVVALEKMLAAWNEMLVAAIQERDAAEQNYKDVSAQVLTVKTAAERVDVINQMQLANDAILVAAARVSEIQEKIDRANSLKKERQEAARILAEKDASIAAFLKGTNANQK